MRAGAVIAFACAVAGCDDPIAPEEPSWQVDLMPMFAANCVRCHAYPFRGLGETALRLDAFDDTVLPVPLPGEPGSVASGVASNKHTIQLRTQNTTALLPGDLPMPPDRPLDDYERTLIRNWAALGADTGAVRGPGHPDNHLPEMMLTEVTRTPTTVTFAYEITDADGDLVVATVFRPPFSEKPLEPTYVVGNGTAGRGQFVWHTAGLAAGDYPLRVRLDDGADLDPVGDADYIELDLGSVTLP